MASSSGTSNTSACPDDILIDDFYFSALFDYDEMFPISDENYAHEFQFQEVLLSSAFANSSQNNKLTSRIIVKDRGNHNTYQETNAGDVLPLLCMICMEPKPYTEIFRNNTCTCVYSYCSECISKHIAVKIQENISNVNCPSLNCRGVLEPRFCQDIIPKQVFDRWEDALCESLIMASKRLYCPYKDCSVVLIDDGNETVTMSECPSCRRLFCAQCLVTWHSGMDCFEFQRLGKNERGQDDLIAMELAKKNKWRRCPKCKFYVEKRDGCMHITCRCKFEFCYSCGAKWTSNHNGCSQRQVI